MRASRIRRLRSLSSAIFSACCVIACSGAGIGVRTLRPDADEAVQLAAQLPRAVSRCVVARPSQVSPERRALVKQVAQAGPLAWLDALEIRAYASATRLFADGTRSEVILLRAAEPIARVRAVLAAQPYLGLAWDGESPRCEDADCTQRAARADVLRDGTVRIRVGRMDVRGEAGLDPPRIDAPCARLALESPDAIEVSAAASELPGVERELRVMHVEATRVVAEETLLTDGPLSTQRTIEVLELGGFAAGERLVGAWRTVSRVAHVDGVVTNFEASLDDLALRRGDERRLSNALRYEHALERPLSAADIDVADSELVLRQATLHLDHLGPLRGEARVDAARALEALLVAAHEVLPDEGGIARRLVRLRLDELDDGAGAATIAAQMLPNEPSGAREWRQLEREGRALSASPELAALLVRDDVATARDAVRVAADVSVARRSGVAYAWAEGAAIAGQRMDALSARAATSVVPAVRLALAGLPAGLVALTELGAVDGYAPRAVYLLAHGATLPSEAEGGARTLEESRTRPVRIHGARGGESLVFAGRSDEGTEPLVTVGRALAGALDAGTDVEIALALVPWDARAFAPSMLLVLSGRIEEGALVVTRVSRNGAAIDWDVVRRTLVAPHAAIERRFPAPEIAVELRSGEEALRVAERVVDAECRVDAASVICAASTAEELGEAFVSMAAPLLGTTPRALWGVAQAPRSRGAARRAPP